MMIYVMHIYSPAEYKEARPIHATKNTNFTSILREYSETHSKFLLGSAFSPCETKPVTKYDAALPYIMQSSSHRPILSVNTRPPL